jgi:hypothetical protein
MGRDILVISRWTDGAVWQGLVPSVLGMARYRKTSGYDYSHPRSRLCVDKQPALGAIGLELRSRSL